MSICTQEGWARGGCERETLSRDRLAKFVGVGVYSSYGYTISSLRSRFVRLQGGVGSLHWLDTSNQLLSSQQFFQSLSGSQAAFNQQLQRPFRTRSLHYPAILSRDCLHRVGEFPRIKVPGPKSKFRANGSISPDPAVVRIQPSFPVRVKQIVIVHFGVRPLPGRGSAVMVGGRVADELRDCGWTAV